ncbi:MAG TPA: methyl-accepting chemotaxis protein, partial [Bacillota bacterium]|nr:methyl-accepting chemotaxis protein [Bacillota bacterium]
EAADLTQAARGGRLSVRGKAENFQGAFADIISGVNKTLDAVIYPLNVAAEYIRQIGEGNIPEPIIEMYEGDFAVIKNDLNACIAAVNALISDVNDLTWSAKEGKLDIRADITRHKGDFCKIVNGINQTLDAIVGPLNDAGAVLNRMGVNDFSVAMEPEIYQGMLRTLAEEINRVRISLLNVQDAMVRVAQGDTSRLAEVKTIGKRSEYDHLNPALTGMMQAIEDLVDEATRITQAAVCGDLQLRGDVRKFTGGYLQIVAGFNHALDAMIEPIDEAARVLHEMAQGNLQQSMTGDYKGAYARIQENLNYTLAVFNDVLSNMDMVANQVAQAAYQVAESSQVLTREATLQADVVQELSVSMEQIAFQTKQNALNANQANHLAVDAQTIGMTGDSRMKELLQAMAEINEASGRISQIIKVINEIAFQTNVLALNASVEAARAGQYGRGFAVVAGEVRNLASRSAQASKETTTLIEGTIGKVATGTEIVKETAEALTRILENSEQTSERIQSIAKASSEQDSGITQLALGIEQVNRAIQHNTTTSQENAAASEKLSNQADQLRAMVRRFKLNSQAESMLPDKRL